MLLYGKTMENLSNRIDVNFVRKKKILKVDIKTKLYTGALIF